MTKQELVLRKIEKFLITIIPLGPGVYGLFNNPIKAGCEGFVWFFMCFFASFSIWLIIRSIKEPSQNRQAKE